MPKHVGVIKDYPITSVVCAFNWFSKRNYVAGMEFACGIIQENSADIKANSTCRKVFTIGRDVCLQNHGN